MRQVEIEAWAMRVVEVVGRGDKVEDSAVELKSDGPNPVESARRIAGLANALRGAPTLWIIGLDESRVSCRGRTPIWGSGGVRSPRNSTKSPRR